MSIDHQTQIRGRWIACASAIVATALATTAVQAQLTAPNDQGVMSFPNVRVINMAPPVSKSLSGAPSNEGMRAFLDPETGALTENPTPAHLEDLEHAVANNGTFTKNFRAPPPTFRFNGKAVGVRLDESNMMYAVARRADDGDVAWACVIGVGKAHEILSGRGETLPHVHSSPVAGTVAK